MTKSKRAERAVGGYECAICRKVLPSPEAGEAHLSKRHDGHGYLTWFDARLAAARGRK